jgi:HEAT repeat protein
VTAPEEAIRNTLSELFDAEREARRIHDELASNRAQRGQLIAALRSVIDDVGGEGEGVSEREAVVKLVCAARLLGEFEGAEVADALVDVLGSVHPEARSEAGEQLQGLAYDRFKEVALAVERALERFEGGHALVELPYVLADIPEGGVVRLLSKFLSHEDGDAVAAAIEALVEVGDPAALEPLKGLTGDKRVSRIGDEDDPEGGEVTVGELAEEAIEILQQMSEADEG